MRTDYASKEWLRSRRPVKPVYVGVLLWALGMAVGIWLMHT